jgi:hypothetical protein
MLCLRRALSFELGATPPAFAERGRTTIVNAVMMLSVARAIFNLLLVCIASFARTTPLLGKCKRRKLQRSTPGFSARLLAGSVAWLPELLPFDPSGARLCSTWGAAPRRPSAPRPRSRLPCVARLTGSDRKHRLQILYRRGDHRFASQLMKLHPHEEVSWHAR